MRAVILKLKSTSEKNPHIGNIKMIPSPLISPQTRSHANPIYENAWSEAVSPNNDPGVPMSAPPTKTPGGQNHFHPNGFEGHNRFQFPKNYYANLQGTGPIPLSAKTSQSFLGSQRQGNSILGLFLSNSSVDPKEDSRMEICLDKKLGSVLHFQNFEILLL